MPEPIISFGKSATGADFNLSINEQAGTSVDGNFRANVPSKFYTGYELGEPVSSWTVDPNYLLSFEHNPNSVGLGTPASTTEELFDCNLESKWKVTGGNGQVGEVLRDYVIEEGSSGDWTWRKWQSGLKEAWINVTTTTKFTRKRYYANAKWYSTRGTDSIDLGNFPTELVWTKRPHPRVFSHHPDISITVGGNVTLTAAGTVSTWSWKEFPNNTTINFTVYFWEV